MVCGCFGDKHKSYKNYDLIYQDDSACHRAKIIMKFFEGKRLMIKGFLIILCNITRNFEFSAHQERPVAVSTIYLHP